MRNIELKARLRDRANALSICEAIGATFWNHIHQVDTYFKVPDGRLKLREADPGGCELVYYRRPNIAGPKGCDYTIEPAEPSIKHLLVEALEQLAVVDKIRTLYLWSNVRIHLDLVQGLGDFIEFEAVLDATHNDADGHTKLEMLTIAFGLKPDDHETWSYLDLVLAPSVQQDHRNEWNPTSQG
jgi:adenylate cyclase class 2